MVFCDGRRRHWWDRVFRTPTGFSHVYALRWDGWNWIRVNPHIAYTDVAILPVAVENALHVLVEPGSTVLEVEAFRNEDQVRGRWWVGPMTCVEQIKALLGLPVGWIYTPWQLYRYLMEHADGIQAENPRTDRAGTRARAPSTICVRPRNP